MNAGGTAFPHLFSPIQLERHRVRNRMFITGHMTMTVTGGVPSEQQAASYEARAKGGVGMIVMEAAAVYPTGVRGGSVIDATRDDCVPGYARIAEACGAHGVPVMSYLHASFLIPNTNRRSDDIRACIGCNQACIGHAQEGYPISCIQRRETGRENTYGTLKLTARRKRIFVAGGGPAGMKAATVAAEGGHDVTLYEAAPRLGGQALLAQLRPGRTETTLERELEGWPGDVHLAGDCLAPRTVEEAVLESLQAGSAV